MKSKIKHSFDKGANSYDQLNDIQNQSLNDLINFMEINIPSNFFFDKKLKVLELGCGTSELTKRLYRKYLFSNCELLDISKKMIKISQKKLKKFNFKYQNQDFDDFQQYNLFDLIYSNMSLHWSTNMLKLVSKIISNMKSKSIFCFTFPNKASFKTFIYYLTQKNIFINMNPLPSKNSFDNIYNLHNVEIKKFEIAYKKKFESPINFFRELKSIGAGTSVNTKRNNLFEIRHIKKERIEVDYNISFQIIKKL